jgi:hypothetical protein
MSNFIQEGLVGAKENFATTIRALTDREWDTNNQTIMPKPTVISGENEPNTVNPTEMLEAITFDEGRTTEITSSNDWMQFEMETDVIITIFGPTQAKRELLEHEVRRILRKNAPLNGSKIKKSNNNEDSAILKIVNPVLQFIPNEVGTNRQQKSSKSQAMLKVRWQNSWVP